MRVGKCGEIEVKSTCCVFMHEHNITQHDYDDFIRITKSCSREVTIFSSYNLLRERFQ